MGWWPRSRRRRALDAIAVGVTTDQRRLLAERLPWWHELGIRDREALEDLTVGLLAQVEFEAAQGFEVRPSMTLLIAAQAGLPLVGIARRDGAVAALDHYRDVGAVVVHPTTVVQDGPRPTGIRHVVTEARQHLLGQAQLHGPVLLAWDDVRRGLLEPGTGRNVVFHEFAHKLDMRDGLVNGTPLLGDRDLRRRWHDLATEELQLLRRGGRGVLRSYGAQNPAEFFAVAVEAFLDDPIRLAEEKPDFYDVLVDLFHQDPAARLTLPPSQVLLDP